MRAGDLFAGRIRTSARARCVGSTPEVGGGEPSRPVGFADRRRLPGRRAAKGMGRPIALQASRQSSRAIASISEASLTIRA
jgi:hypothetical protein